MAIAEPEVMVPPPALGQEPPALAHIVRTDPGESAAAKVMEARVTGTPVEALCGHVWVPNRDPRSLPMCPVCKDIYDQMRAVNGDLPETPPD